MEMKPETIRLYFEDPYKVEFEAHVRDRRLHDKRTALVLDHTAFYPESGGQPADLGTLNGIQVIDVVEDEGEILHVLAGSLDEDKVKGKIDWVRRFDHMQQHAGQHILSQSFYELFQGETRSFHLGESVSTLEIGLKDLSRDDQTKVEARANEVVFQDRPIRSRFVEEAKIAEIPLRRPPQKKGRIRVIEVEKFDYTACGGTHPVRSGEVGMIKILKTERIRGNIRFEFVCGGRALRDYGDKDRVLRDIARKFTVSEKDADGAVDRALADMKTLRREKKKLFERLVEYEAAELIDGETGPIIQRIYAERALDELRGLALKIIKNSEKIVLFISEKASRRFVVFARPEHVEVDLRDLLPAAASLFEGRGGGGPSLVQITGATEGDATAILDAARKFLALKLPELDL